MNWPRISMVVVNKDLGDYLDEALASITSQGYPNLELIVVDAASKDHSVDIIRKYEEHIHWWVSEPDEGQYQGIEKGFAQTTGEIMAWLNSDDKLMPKSLFQVARVFNRFPEVEWIQGSPMEYTPEGGVINRTSIPWARWSKFRYLTYDFQFIQQESTFWKRTLWEKAGAHLSHEASLAGDMELWARFFRHAKLYTCLLSLSGFRHRQSNQRSKDNAQAYMDEAIAIVRRERKRYSLLRRGWFSVLRVIMFPFGILFFYNIPGANWVYRDAYRLPPLIGYDLDHHEYSMRSGRVIHPPLLWRGRQVRTKPAKKEN